MRRFTLLVLLPLCGCYNSVILTVGGVTRSAVSVGPQMAPEVQCAALAQPKLTVDGASLDAVKTCEQAVATQRRIDAQKGKK